MEAGIGNIRWTSSVYLVYFDFYVEDMAADGDHAEGRVQVITPNEQVHSFPWHKAIGYHAVNRFPTHVRDYSGVKAIRVEGCRRGDDLHDYCDTSDWVYQEW